MAMNLANPCSIQDGEIGEILDFFDEIDARISRLEENRSSDFVVSREAYGIVKDILTRETSISNIHESKFVFLEDFYAERHIVRLLELLLENVRFRLNAVSARSPVKDIAKKALLNPRFPADEAVKALRSFFEWYTRRKFTLLCYDAECKTSNRQHSMCTIFGVSLFEGAQWRGLTGLEAVLSLFLRGCRGIQIWVKGELRKDGKPVFVREGWESWSDIRNGARQGKRFAVLHPLLPDSDCMVVDKLRLFSPEAAIDLPEGVHHVTFCIGVYGANGQLLTNVTSDLGVRVIPKSYSETSPVPSPQKSALWKQEPGTEGAIYELEERGGLLHKPELKGKGEIKIKNLHLTFSKGKMEIHYELNGAVLKQGNISLILEVYSAVDNRLIAKAKRELPFRKGSDVALKGKESLSLKPPLRFKCREPARIKGTIYAQGDGIVSRKEADVRLPGLFWKVSQMVFPFRRCFRR